jgi:hypothetical protein
LTAERAALERDVARLASERTELFSRSGGRAGLSMADQNRLRVIERELDESFTALRRARAARDASRFVRDSPTRQPFNSDRSR